MHNDFIRGRIVQQAQNILTLYVRLNISTQDVSDVKHLLDQAEQELLRLCDNELQMRAPGGWGDVVQLAGLITLLVDDYRSTALDVGRHMAGKGATTCK